MNFELQKRIEQHKRKLEIEQALSQTSSIRNLLDTRKVQYQIHYIEFPELNVHSATYNPIDVFITKNTENGRIVLSAAGEIVWSVTKHHEHNLGDNNLSNENSLHVFIKVATKHVTSPKTICLYDSVNNQYVVMLSYETFIAIYSELMEFYYKPWILIDSSLMIQLDGSFVRVLNDSTI